MNTLTLWPPCANEFETILACSRGKSLARFGDGELKLMSAQGYAREPSGNEKLAKELRTTLLTPNTSCLVGIPTMDPAGPKYQFIEPANGQTSGWIRHRSRFMSLLKDSSVPLYYSAFVTRPDSAPWIRTKDFACQVQALWTEKLVALVCEKSNSLYQCIVPECDDIIHIRCPSEQAYAQIDALEEAVLKHKPELAVLSCGPTATCLANRLAGHGIQALDLGSMGGWLKQLLDTKHANK